MKKILLGTILILMMNHTFADNCSTLNAQAEKKALPVIPRWGLAVKSKQRVYFHSAPVDRCKIKGLFIIHDDHVTAYDLYTDSAHQEWVYVMYYSKRKDLENEMVEGWVKLKALEYMGTDSPTTE